MTLPEAPAVAEQGGGPARKRRLAAALVLAALAAFPAGAPRADDDPYTAMVSVDATADSIVNAREKARHEGEHKALAAIADHFTPGAAASPKLAKLDDAAVTNLVGSFEVANEHMSAVRYIADYTFHFRPAETQRVLRAAGINPNAATAANQAGTADGKPAVVLPVYQSAGHTVLWDDPNPWRDAWAQLTPPAGPLPLTVPLGDVGDLAAIDAAKARAADAEALAAIAKKNGGDDAIVALATARDPGKGPPGLDVSVRRYRQGKLAETHFAPLDAKPGEAPDALLPRAAAAVAANIEGGWKQETANAGQQGSLTATAAINGLDDWVKLRDSLASIGAIRKLELTALSRQQAVVEIEYLGSVDQLQANLAALGIRLARGDQADDRSWRLARSDSPTH